MKKLFFLILIIALACAGPFRRGGALRDGPVPFQTILAGSHSLADTAFVELVTNKREWENIWLIAKGLVDPLPTRPTVDFSRQYVIAAFMGQRESSGYRIEVTSIEKAGRILNVYIKRYETPGMLTVITNPFTLVRLPKGSYRLKIIEQIVR
jgi:hypothetical protein